MESVEHLDVDEIWKALDRFGRYQVTQLLMMIIGGIPMSFHLLSIVFIGKDIDHVCKIPPEVELNHNASVITDSCEIRVVTNSSTGINLTGYTCPDGYNYTSDRSTSFVAEWDLVCEKDALGKLSQTLVMVGMFLGAFFLPAIGDRLGRKRLHVTSHFVSLLVTVAMAFIPNFIGFAVLRVFVGALQQGYFIPLYVMMIELFPAEQRELISFSGSLQWATSVILITPIAYYMQNYSWRSMQLVLAVFSAISIVEFFLLDESLRWLVANKRNKEAINIIKKACKMNHKDFRRTWKTIQEKSNTRLLLTTDHSSEHEVRTGLLNKPEETYDMDKPKLFGVLQHDHGHDRTISKSAMKISFLDLLKNPTLRPMAIIVCYMWFTNAITYYGLALVSSSLAGDPYVNFLLGAVLEIPADILMWILLAKIGRKKTCIVFHTGAGVALLITVLVVALTEKSYTTGKVQTAFYLAGRFFSAGAFNAVWMYTPELFPTNIRNIGVGMASSTARIGGMASPFFNSLAKVAIWGPGAIFSGLCLLVSFLVTFLPETSGRELPHTIEELVEWSRIDKAGKKNEGKTREDIQFEKI